MEDVQSSDINNDGRKVVCASNSKGVKLFNISKVVFGMKLFNSTTTLRKEETEFVRFVNEPQGLLYPDGDDRVHLMSMSGVVLRSFSGKHHPYSPTLINNDEWLVTGNKDNSINIHDVETGEIIHMFYHPLSDGFESSFVYNPDTKKMIGCTKSGKLFVLTH